MSQASLEHPTPPAASPQVIGDAAFDALARHLSEATGIVLPHSKRGLAVSRLSKRIRLLGLPDFDAYCALLGGPAGADELQEMVLLLTTNVTRFFREAHHFHALRDAILPSLIEKARSGGRVRIWSAGCSSGEEAFSIAMTALSRAPDLGALDVRILATDIDRNVLNTARAGRYRLTAEDQEVMPLMVDHLIAVPDEPGVFEVSPEARGLVQFALLNLQQPWPMQGKFDVIFCRNVVIYFSTETQRALWPRFADALHPGGHLMIGHSERVSGPAATRLRSCGVTQYQLHP